MKINSNLINNINNIEHNKQNQELPSFENFISNTIDNLNSEQVVAENNTKAIADGSVKNLQESVLQINKAELNMKLSVAIRNKLIESYKEISKITI